MECSKVCMWIIEKGETMAITTANAPNAQTNANLHRARNAQNNDEFYTQITDIENELKYYKHHFRGKVVYCNCDDPRFSNFFHYFSHNFEKLGLKKLITTCYRSTHRDFFSKDAEDTAIYLEYDGAKKGERVPDPEEIGITHLKGDGDFRNEECIELLKEVDIVVTNPPFSKFRDYLAQLIKHNKKFLIVGHKNAITYREVFKLLKDNKIWVGYNSGGMDFEVPDHYEQGQSGFIKDGKKWQNVGAIWYTNLDISKRNEYLDLYREYNPKDYPKYENYDAINVGKVANIPVDYDGAMGVPITFMNKYNPDQFEIIGLGISNSGLEVGVQPYKKEHKKYRREIQRKGAVDGDLYMMIKGEVTVPYARILIRNKK